jgi:NADH dehydrogenase
MNRMASVVTVFGGSGFVGRHTVQALARAGYRIRVAVRYPNQAPYLPPMGTVGQIQLVKCNVLDEDAVTRVVQGSDAVVNLVGILYPAGGQGFEDVHVTAATLIAKAAKAAGVQSLVHISTTGVSIESESSYSRTKAEGEDAVRHEFANATILRSSIVFGPEDAFFNKFAAIARFSPILPLIGGGYTKFQPVCVTDIAHAVAKCVGDAATHGKTYELGGPTVYSFKQLMQIVLRETGRSRALVPVPFFLASLKAMFLQFLPGTSLTPDQVTSLKSDNVVAACALTLADLGVIPDSLEAVLPSYLWRFRAKGQFENSASERAIGAPAIR